MADGHGGYRQPGKPAAVSGPGALSQRTDGRPQPVRDLPDAAYGEGAAFREMQQGAPMARTAPPVSGGPGGMSPADVTPFHAGTAMPNVPVTDGADAGAGAGSAALALPPTGMKGEAQQLGKWLPVMIRVADSPSATPEFRQYVRALLANIG